MARRKKPRPRRTASVPGLTQAEYARQRGVTRQAIANAVRAGRLPTIGKTGRIDPKVADRVLRERTDPSKLRGRHAGPEPPAPGGNGESDFWRSKARHEFHRANLAELEEKERRRQLLHAERVRAVIFEGARRARDQLLAIPDRLETRLKGVTDPLEVRQILMREVRQIAEEISNAEQLFAETVSEQPEPETPQLTEAE